MKKVYLCVPIKFKDDERIAYEIETARNYYLSQRPADKDNVEFVTNFMSDGQSRNYSLSDMDFRNAAIDELSEAVARLKDCNHVVMHPDYEADDVCKTIEFICKSYQFKTAIMYIGK